MAASDNTPSLAQAVNRARRCPDFMAELASLYDEVDAAIDALDIRCMGGGTCCRFDVAGHRLYVSTGELAYLLGSPPATCPVMPLRCPYQLGPLCRARPHRPLGCRTFFCRASKEAHLDDLYERIHRQVKALHIRHDVPYYYVEATAALAEAMDNHNLE